MALMTNSPRVCQLITALPYGGAEHMVRDLVSAADEIPFTVGIFGHEDDLAPDIEATGTTVRHFNEGFRFDPRGIKRFHRFLRENRFDVLHLHLPYTQTLGRLIGSVNDIEGIVSTQHNVPSNYHPVTRTTERLTRPLDDVTVAVSQGVERAFTGNSHEPGKLGNDWCTIYNGIDVKKFAKGVENADGMRVRQQLGIDPETPILLNVGRYVPVKGQPDLIANFDRIEADAHLVIVGHGELEEKLRFEVRRHDIKDSVHVTGRVPEVHPYYAAADVFVSASRAEGHPITILEAMSATLPVVAPAIPGVKEAVYDGETGILYPLGQPDKLLKAIEELTDDQTRKQYGKAGHVRAREHFDVRSMAESYIRLYERLSGEA